MWIARCIFRSGPRRVSNGANRDFRFSRRRRNEKSEENHPAGDRVDAVFRHVSVLQRGFGVDADVAVLRSSAF